MKTLIKPLFILLIMAELTACKKDAVKATALTSLNFTNAVINAPTMYLNSAIDSVTNNSFGEFSLLTGQTQYKVYALAGPSQPFYNQTVTTANGGYYSLFLSGLSTSAIDAVFIKETYKNYIDSLSGVRFINLSPDSQPISVDIQGNANGSEVASLAYKAYTGFKQHAATQAVSSYNFEIRDAATGTLLTTYTFNTPYFHNVTLAIIGSESAGTVGILQDNDF